MRKLIVPICISIPILLSCVGSPQTRTFHRPQQHIDPAARIAVVPAKMGKAEDLVLPDAIATELLGLGFNVVERTTVRQVVKERGLDFTEILNGEEYFKLGNIAQIQNLVLVNATMKGQGVASATVRAVDTSSGEIFWSTTYSQPAPDNPAYIFHDTLLDTARRIAKDMARGLSLSVH